MKKNNQKKSKIPSSDSKKNDLLGLFAELKGEYLDTFPEKIKSIETFWQKRDRKNLQNEYHKIKGTGSTYGAEELSTIADIMEELCERDSQHLGMSIMISLDAFQKVCHHHRKNIPIDLNKEKFFRLLRHYQNQLNSAS